MIQKRSRIKINTDLAKIRQAGKNPQEVQKELLEFFEKRGFEYERVCWVSVSGRDYTGESAANCG